MSVSPDKRVPTPADGVDGRRRRARKTAIVIGAIALLVYGGFILSGVLAQ